MTLSRCRNTLTQGEIFCVRIERAEQYSDALITPQAVAVGMTPDTQQAHLLLLCGRQMYLDDGTIVALHRHGFDQRQHSVNETVTQTLS